MGVRADSPTVRPLRRADLADLTALRRRFHAERVPRGAHGPESEAERTRIATTTQALWENEATVVFVVEGASATRRTDGRRPLVGYALGRHAVWPPIWRTQRVGEVIETFVVPFEGAPEHLVRLLGAVAAELSRRDVEVLRARVACDDLETRTRFEALGFTPLLRTFVRASSPSGPGDASIRIRPARAADVPSLVLLSLSMLAENGRHEPRLAPHPDAAASLATRHLEEVCDPRHVVLVAEEKPGLLVGLAAGQLGRGDGLRRPARDATITACFVVPPRRRRGLARRLADRVADALVVRGADELRLHVVAKNAGSLAFWSSLGYEPVEELLDRPA